jgi:hypothetical protein
VATSIAIAAVGEALCQLLDGACPRGPGDDFRGARFRVLAAAQFEGSPPALTDGASLFLYRVAVNGPQRNRAGRTGPDGKRYRPSLPVDLYYLLTPWGGSAAYQQQLLGWAMRTLEDAAILPAGLLNHALGGQSTFRPEETVEVVAEPMSLQDQSSLWQALRVGWQLSASYVARMVALDSTVELAEAPRVRERGFAPANGAGP